MDYYDVWLSCYDNGYKLIVQTYIEYLIIIVFGYRDTIYGYREIVVYCSNIHRIPDSGYRMYQFWFAHGIRISYGRENCEHSSKYEKHGFKYFIRYKWTLCFISHMYKTFWEYIVKFCVPYFILPKHKFTIKYIYMCVCTAYTCILYI